MTYFTELSLNENFVNDERGHYCYKAYLINLMGFDNEQKYASLSSKEKSNATR